MNAILKSKPAKIIHVFLWILAVILFAYGAGASTRAETERALKKAANQFEIQITDKSNDRTTSYDIYCNIKFTIKNNSDKQATKVSGSMKITDMDGNVLSSGTASFRGDFTAKSENFFTLNWSMDITDDAKELWETDFSMLNISFDIEEITFDGNHTVKAALDPFVKPCESELLENTYNSACNHMQLKQFDEAIELLNQIQFYKDSAQLIESCKMLKAKELLASASIGSLVTFGTYEQDSVYDNGAESIQWIVLAKEDDKVLLLSEYALEETEYDYNGNIVWKTSSLRAWLNDSFLSTAFTEAEKEQIVTTSVTPSDIELEKGGAETNDKVFILSAEELEEYVLNAEQRCSKLSDYVYYRNSSSYWGGSSYWLRTPGPEREYYYSTYPTALVVDSDGDIVTDGEFTDSKMVVRPAMWVSIES
ncbi:MAG: hypothetical protein E7637_07550 [Ruminococcaceae bacterium]|nr:hypothetical protein [Oscillospiraceae bacterium]